MRTVNSKVLLYRERRTNDTGMSSSLTKTNRSVNEANNNTQTKPMTTDSELANNNGQRKSLIDTFIDRNEKYWANRVVLKFDVSYTDHSHIIGRHGANTQNVMKQTGCYIHFPDLNRFSQVEKSNIVSITGPFAMIEKARRAIRDLSPLVISIQLPKEYDSSRLFELFQEPSLYDAVSQGMLFHVRNDTASQLPFLIVRASCHQVESVLLVVTLLKRLLSVQGLLCFTSLHILKPAQRSVLGDDERNVQWISDWTGATIFYPKRGSNAALFFIQGSIEQVLLARKCLLAFQPLSLTFEWRRDSNNNTNESDLQRLKRDLAVCIDVKYNSDSEERLVTVTGRECQVNEMYQVRAVLVSNGIDSDNEEPVCDEYDIIKNRLLSSCPFYTEAQSFGFWSPAMYLCYPTTGLPCHRLTCINCAQTALTDDPLYYDQEQWQVGNWCDETKLDSGEMPPAVSPSIFPTLCCKTSRRARNKLRWFQIRRSLRLRNLPTSDYGKWKLCAERAIEARISGKSRRPTAVWCGAGFSRSTACLNTKLPASPASPDVHEFRSLPATPIYGNRLRRIDNLRSLLQKLRLEKYIDTFQVLKIDLNDMPDMGEAELRHIGVNPAGRRRILGAITEPNDRYSKQPKFEKFDLSFKYSLLLIRRKAPAIKKFHFLPFCSMHYNVVHVVCFFFLSEYLAAGCLTRKTAGTAVHGSIRISLTTPVTNSAGKTSHPAQQASFESELFAPPGNIQLMPTHCHWPKYQMRQG
ncbi:Protein bicaudal C -like protein 1 [Trichinella zimbabwensis]|uniref:Protein bicaudal C-like protein 1 n=1 Tax=Trichinella zimbabwensis TaxID=268475 RepID=A0A0V1HMU2_9BILA|nr:Protein bicaudal C -like protein 1 [Trichinella zimbabwensis]